MLALHQWRPPKLSSIAGSRRNVQCEPPSCRRHSRNKTWIGTRMISFHCKGKNEEKMEMTSKSRRSHQYQAYRLHGAADFGEPLPAVDVLPLGSFNYVTVLGTPPPARKAELWQQELVQLQTGQPLISNKGAPLNRTDPEIKIPIDPPPVSHPLPNCNCL